MIVIDLFLFQGQL